MLTSVTLKHPLSKKTFVALLDTGSTRSMVAKEVVSWFTPQQRSGDQYRNVNGELQQSLGTIELPFVLTDFSDKRCCVHEFMVGEKMIHPLILGTDFIMRQKMGIDFGTETITWDGIQIPIEDKPAPEKRVVFAVEDGESRTMRKLDVTGKELQLKALVPKEHLSGDEKQRLRTLLESFRFVFLGKIGTLKLPPYKIPVKPGCRPSAQKPYPIPLIFQGPTMREVERLVKLGVLEPDKDSPWAAPAFIIPKKDGSIRFFRLRAAQFMLRAELLSIAEDSGFDSRAPGAGVCVIIGFGDGVL